MIQTGFASIQNDDQESSSMNQNFECEQKNNQYRIKFHVACIYPKIIRQFEKFKRQWEKIKFEKFSVCMVKIILSATLKYE